VSGASTVPNAAAHRARSPDAGRLLAVVRIWLANGPCFQHRSLSISLDGCRQYLWAALMARIYEVFPLLCPQCGGQTNLIAFITDGLDVRKILTHIGAEPVAPRVTPARGTPLWEDCDAPQSEAAGGREPDWDFAPQVAPDDQFDQRISW
jgi:hypothetical protein